MKNNNETAQTPSELLNDLQTLVTEAEAMIAGSATEHSADAFDSLRSRFSAAQERFTDAYAGARKKGHRRSQIYRRNDPRESLPVAGHRGRCRSARLGVLAGRRSK